MNGELGLSTHLFDSVMCQVQGGRGRLACINKSSLAVLTEVLFFVKFTANLLVP